METVLGNGPGYDREIGSQPTYKEWKPRFRVLVAGRRWGFPAYLQGMETSLGRWGRYS